MTTVSRWHVSALLSLSLIPFIAPAACSDTPVDADSVGTVEVEPERFTLQVGASRQLTARVKGSDGNILSDHPVIWTSDDSSVATVSSGGLVRGLVGGTVEITATSEGVTGQAAGTVENPLPSISSTELILARIDDPWFTLILNGSGFVSTSEVHWNGSARPSSYQSSSQLQAEISALDIASDGAAQVTVSNPPPAGGSSDTMRLAVGRSCQPGRLVVGNSITGSLPSNDCRLSDGKHLDIWEFEGDAGELVHLALGSNALDPFALLAGSDGRILSHDEDSGRGMNSRLSAELPSAGAHFIVVTSLAGETGSYLLRTRSLWTILLDNEVTEAISNRDEVEAWGFFTSTDPQGILLIGIEESGSIDLGLTAYEFKKGGEPLGGNNDQVVRGSDREPVGEIIMGIAEEPGLKALEVVGVGGSRGGYSLDLQQCRVHSASLGSSVSDSVTAHDCTSVTKAHGIYVTFEASTGTEVTLDLTSEWDNFLVLASPDGSLLALDDDSGGGVNARITTTLPLTGTYIAFASSFSPGVTGSFTLSLASSSAARTEPPVGGPGGLTPQKGTTGGVRYDVSRKPGSIDNK